MKYQDQKLLKKFMQEFFPFNNFKKIGLFTAEMKGDYEAQANKVCYFFGYETIYEYGAKGFRGHVSFDRTTAVTPKGELTELEPFITVIPSIYETPNQ